MFPLKPLGENPSLPPLRFLDVAVIFGVPCLVEASLQSLPPLSYGVLPCASVQISPLRKDTNHIGSKAHPTPVLPHLYLLITSATTLLPNKVTFSGGGG